MAKKYIEYVNSKINRLFITGYVNDSHYSSPKFNYRCECGKEGSAFANNITRGHTKSCGCFQEETKGLHKRTHGMSNHPVYVQWARMKQRCYSVNSPRYRDWGGRGIIVCDEWKSSFVNFKDWALNNGWQHGLEIDRKENDGNYEPGNCRFVTPSKNSRNKRNNVYITYNGETMCAIDWAERYNLKLGTLLGRIKSKWPVEKLFIPLLKTRTKPYYKKS